MEIRKDEEKDKATTSENSVFAHSIFGGKVRTLFKSLCPIYDFSIFPIFFFGFFAVIFSFKFSYFRARMDPAAKKHTTDFEKEKQLIREFFENYYVESENGTKVWKRNFSRVLKIVHRKSYSQ